MPWRFSRTEATESRTTLHQLSLTHDLTQLTAASTSISKGAPQTKSQMKVINDNFSVACQAKASGRSHSSSPKACRSRCQSQFRRPKLSKRWAQTRSPLALMWLRVLIRRSSTWTVNLQEFQTQASEAPKVPRATAATALRWRKRFLAAFLTTSTKT